LHFVVACPPAGVSTAEVYRACRPEPGGVVPARLVDHWRRGKLARLGEMLHNALEAAASALTPWINCLKSEFRRLNVLGHQMSGSGTSYFGLCRSARHARVCAAKLQCRGLRGFPVVSVAC
jgi:4-diphosphocytidyl-2-C-methyl-D-erythritol kinase